MSAPDAALVDFSGLDDEQRLLYESVVEFAQRELTPS